MSSTAGPIEVIAVLTEARRLIARGWTQYAFARNVVGGVPVKADASHATCWCLLGAIRAAGRVVPEQARESARVSAGWIVACTIDGSITQFNDSPDRTQADVLALLDKALKDL